MQIKGLTNSLQILALFFLVIAGLYFAKPFLVPVCFGGLLAMLFLPLGRKLQKAGFNKALATTACVLIFILFVSITLMLIAWQVTNLTTDLGNIEEKVQNIVKQLTDFISRSLGISLEQQQQVLQQQTGNAPGVIARFSFSLVGILVNFVLVLVYFFLFMYFRGHIKKFILKVIPTKEGANTEDAISNIEKVSQQYLMGMGLMIITLWVMYTIGFSLVGLKNAVFFAVMCGIFEIVPYVGNITGNILAALMAYTQGGGISMIIGVLVVYSLVQTIQTYFIEPLVVGPGVNINPLFTIIGLVLGELLWGISGMVLAIPLLAIVKIICDHIEPLKPYGFLIGRERTSKKTMVERVKSWFKHGT